MDFSARNAQSAAPGAHSAASSRKSSDDNKWGRIGFVGLIVAVVVLLIAVVVAVGLGGDSKDNEQKYVDSGKLQAVFLSTGQVYFGNVKEVNSKYFVLSNIYYLQTSSTGTTQTNANTSVSLVKLGCELHSPFDQMLINRSQVTFWENLQDSGQVAKAVKTFKQQNPSGQKCTDQSNTSSTGATSVQGSTGTSSTPATTTTAKP